VAARNLDTNISTESIDSIGPHRELHARTGAQPTDWFLDGHFEIRLGSRSNKR